MEHYASDWQKHVMGPSSGQKPFVRFEDEDSEILAVDGALQALVDAEILPHNIYNKHKFEKFCGRVETTFEIPWTGISPRMRRAIYAINSIKQPKSIVCAGIFCGYTFICNAGASIGVGKCYEPDNIIGIEILEKEVARAIRNVTNFIEMPNNMIVFADASEWLARECHFKIDLLYIDAKAIEFDPTKQSGAINTEQSEYMKIIQNAMLHLNSGALILAHNSVNAASSVHDYLSFVRSGRFKKSMNLIIDDAGLEVSQY